MAILNGTDIRVYDGSNILIAYAQNGTININHSTRDITNKESAGWSEQLEGLRDWSVDVDGAYAWTDAASPAVALTNGFEDAITNYILTRGVLTVKFGTTAGATGDALYSGSAYITSGSVSAGTEDTATYSLSLIGTGALTITIS
jgi:TP901-1 family phage major tail protein